MTTTANPPADTTSDEPAKPKITDFEPGTILRGPRNGAFRVTDDKPWGRHLVPCKDPEAVSEIDDLRKQVNFPNDFHRLDSRSWAAILSLYFAAANGEIVDGCTEISVCFLRDEETFTNWRVVVPTQKVSGSNVDADYDEPCRDLFTGEELPAPNEMIGWIRAGTSHSHHTMGAFFSGTDDKNELPQPGMHIVVGGMKPGTADYKTIASIVLQQRRFVLDISLLVDVDPEIDVAIDPEWFKDIVKRKTYGSVGSYRSHYSGSPWSAMGWDDDEDLPWRTRQLPYHYRDYKDQRRGGAPYQGSGGFDYSKHSQSRSSSPPSTNDTPIMAKAKIIMRLDDFFKDLAQSADEELQGAVVDLLHKHGFSHAAGFGKASSSDEENQA